MALETAIMIKLFGSAAVLCSRYLLDTPIDAETVAIAECLPAFRNKNNALDARLKAHTRAMNDRLAKAGHAEKAEQLATVAEDVLALALEQDFQESLRQTGLDGAAIWASIAALDAVRDRLSPLNADRPVRDLIPDLMTGLFDAWVHDPKTLEGLRTFQINLAVETKQDTEVIREDTAVLRRDMAELRAMLAAKGAGTVSEDLIEKLLEAFEAANEPKARWFDLLIEKAALLKDLQTRLADLSNADPEVDRLRKRAEDAIEAGELENAEKLLEEAEELDAKAVAAMERDIEERRQNLVQRKESQAASAFSRGELAEAQIRYPQAYRHYRRAYELASENTEYLNKAQNSAYRAGDYPVAIELGEKQRSTTAETHGSDSSDHAFALNELAVAYQASGDLPAAETLYESALELYGDVFGSDHPFVATTLNNLAWLYQAQGKFEEAEPLYKRDLAISEKALGPDHPDVATTLNNLALLYRAQGKFEEAEPLLMRALAIGEKTLGPDHPDVATRLNNLAALYQAQGKYAEAEPLYMRAVAIGEKTLGPDHPEVATWLNNLAGLYQTQGKFDEAEPLYKRALAIGEKALGLDHPDVATRLNNLALLYEAQGKFEEAEPLYKRAIAILEAAFPAGHPNLDGTRKSYANMIAKRDGAP